MIQKGRMFERFPSANQETHLLSSQFTSVNDDEEMMLGLKGGQRLVSEYRSP